jgi:hypothetical protein
MNLLKLGKSSWIIIVNIILAIILLMSLTLKSKEMFTNYPQPINPMDKAKSTSEAASANNNYASILMYVKNNPGNSVKFIQDIKQKFFDSSCTVKPNIDFNNLAQMPNGMPFS